MKNLILATIFGLVAFSANAAQNYIDKTGTVKTLHKKYLVVKNSAASALTEGQFVAPDLTADDGVSVDYVYANSAKAICMVVDVSCGVGEMCKCQTYGFTEVADFEADLGSATAGGPGFARTTGKVSIDSSIAASDYPVGVFVDASSASGDVQFYITLGGGE